MKDYAKELENRVEFIRGILSESGAKGVVFGNSGGKDSALVGILCKKACDNTLGIMMPCASSVNLGKDLDDGNALSEKYGIENRTVDLTAVRAQYLDALEDFKLTNNAIININPRLRMILLYAVAAAENRLVAGTGNRSERYIGYFTKWGDGGCDFNPISDLTVGEVYEFLEYLDAPESIIKKPPSAGLYEGQTDEGEIGLTYKAIDEYLLYGKASDADREKIERLHRNTQHKREMPKTFK